MSFPLNSMNFSNPNLLTVGNAFGLVENKNVGMPSIVPVTTGKVGPKYALGPVSE